MNHLSLEAWAAVKVLGRVIQGCGALGKSRHACVYGALHGLMMHAAMQIGGMAHWIMRWSWAHAAMRREASSVTQQSASCWVLCEAMTCCIAAAYTRCQSAAVPHQHLCAVCFQVAESHQPRLTAYASHPIPPCCPLPPVQVCCVHTHLVERDRRLQDHEACPVQRWRREMSTSAVHRAAHIHTT